MPARATGDTYLVARASTIENAFVPQAPTAFGLLSTSSGGKQLTYEQGAALCIRNGWNTETLATECTAVMRQESAFRTKAISYIGCCYGLLQVYASLHNTTREAMFDSEQNVAKAREIYLASGSWQPWEAWTGPDGQGSDGPWLQWEARAREAAVLQLSCGSCAHASIASAPSTGAGSNTLSWSTDCANCTFPVERRVPDGEWAAIGEAKTSTSITDNNAEASTIYEYRARASNSVGASDWVTTTVTTGQADPGSAVGDAPADEAGSGSGVDEDGSNTGSGSECWSINPITVLKCALRWAFVPGAGSQSAWASFKSNTEGNALVTSASVGVTFISKFYISLTTATAAVSAGEFCHDIGPLETSPTVCYFEGVGDMVGVEPLRRALGVGVYFWFAWTMARWIHNIFSPDPTPANSADAEVI
jgi:hypothetical protein